MPTLHGALGRITSLETAMNMENEDDSFFAIHAVALKHHDTVAGVFGNCSWFVLWVRRR